MGQVARALCSGASGYGSGVDRTDVTPRVIGSRDEYPNGHRQPTYRFRRIIDYRLRRSTESKACIMPTVSSSASANEATT